MKKSSLLSNILSAGLAIGLGLGAGLNYALAANPGKGPVLGDYDGNGTSDLAVAIVDRAAKTTNFEVLRTLNGGRLYYRFNVAADALINFRHGDGKYYPGVVQVSDINKPLNWYVALPGGGTWYQQLGRPGDDIPSQGDFDGDGITDLVAVSKGSNGYRLWTIQLSAFGLQRVTEEFGLNTDKVAVGDVNGDGRADKIVFSQQGNDLIWISEPIFSKPQDKLTTKWGTITDYPILPFDYYSKDGNPNYVVGANLGATMHFYVKNGSGFELIKGGSSSSVPVSGNFEGLKSFAWFDRAAGTVSILKTNGTLSVNRLGSSSHAIIRPDGTVIQPNENGQFSETGSSGSKSYLSNCNRTATSIRRPYVFRPYAGKGSKLVISNEYTSRLYFNSTASVYNSATGQFLGETGPFSSLEEGGRMRYYLNPHARNMPSKVDFVVTSNDKSLKLCFVNIDSQRLQK